MTPRFLSTVVEVLGLLAVILGVTMLSIPAGIIVAGLVLVLIGYSVDAPTPGRGKR
jgi:hypothetical protein